jgi:hypothetical protein
MQSFRRDLLGWLHRSSEMPNVSRVPIGFLDGRWFIEILVEDPATRIRTWYAIGPIERWSTARRISALWEKEMGANTTRVAYRRADDRRFGKTPTPVQTALAPIPGPVPDP